MSFQAEILTDISGTLCQIDAGRDFFNMGGVSELFVIHHNGISNIPPCNIPFNTDLKAEFSGDITLAAGVKAYAFKFSDESCDYKEILQEDDGGTYYQQVLSLAIPKDRPEIAWLKYKMRRDRYILIYKDANGLVKLLGHIGQGLRVKMDLDIKKTFAGFNGYTLTATRNTITPACFWDIPLADSILDHLI